MAKPPSHMDFLMLTSFWTSQVQILDINGQFHWHQHFTSCLHRDFYHFHYYLAQEHFERMDDSLGSLTGLRPFGICLELGPRGLEDSKRMIQLKWKNVYRPAVDPKMADQLWASFGALHSWKVPVLLLHFHHRSSWEPFWRPQYNLL